MLYTHGYNPHVDIYSIFVLLGIEVAKFRVTKNKAWNAFLLCLSSCQNDLTQTWFDTYNYKLIKCNESIAKISLFVLLANKNTRKMNKTTRFSLIRSKYQQYTQNFSPFRLSFFFKNTKVICNCSTFQISFCVSNNT